MKNKTQEQCREDYAKALALFVNAVCDIDNDTPAVPTTEPSWWLNMMDMQKSARESLAIVRSR